MAKLNDMSHLAVTSYDDNPPKTYNGFVLDEEATGTIGGSPVYVYKNRVNKAGQP